MLAAEGKQLVHGVAVRVRQLRFERQPHRYGPFQHAGRLVADERRELGSLAEAQPKRPRGREDKRVALQARGERPGR